MYAFGSGWRRRRAGKWMRGLGLVLDVCLCLGCSGMGVEDGEW